MEENNMPEVNDNYNQHNMNVYSTSDMNNYGSMDMNSYGDPIVYSPGQPKKKKKGIKIALIFIISVLVAAIIALVLSIVLKKAPKDVIKDSIEETLSDVSDPEKTIYEDTLGLSDMDKNDIDTEAQFVLNSIYQLENISGSTVTIDGAAEKQEDDSLNASLTAAITIAGESLSSNVYMQDNVFYYDIPGLSDALFKIDTTSAMTELESQMSESGSTNDIDQEELRKLYEQYMTEPQKQLKESISYDRGSKEVITLHNGESVKCRKYTMTIPTENVKDYVSAFCDYLKAYAAEYITDDMYDEMGITEDQFNQVMQYVPTYYGMLFARDFTFNVYVYRGKAERIDFAYRFTMLGADVNVTIDFTGNKNEITGFYGECSVSANDSTVVITAETDRQDTSSTSSFVVKADDTEYVNATYNETFDTSSASFTNTLNVTSSGESIFSLDVTGSFKDIEKGKSYTMVLDSIKATDGGDTVYLDMSGELKCGNLDKAVSQPDTSKTVYDVLDLDDDSMEALIDMDKAQEIVTTWSEALGLISEDDYLDLDDFEIQDDSIESDTEDTGSDEETIIDGGEVELEDEDTSELDYDSTDYSNVVISDDKYTIAINEPAGYERAYADTSEIDIYSGDYSAYYSLKEDADKETLKEEFLSYYDYFGDSCEIQSSDTETITLADGTEVECLVIKSVLYESNITDAYIFYPLQDADVLVVNVEVWGEAELSDMADMFANTDIINIQ